MFSVRGLVGLALVTLFVFVATNCYAIHEDEQGLRDWIFRLVGDVRYAAVPPVADPSHLFVASANGAVAAISLTAQGATNLTWRQLYSDTPKCLLATSHAVVVANEHGSVYVLKPTTGLVDTTFALNLPRGAVMVACSADSGRAHFVAYDGHKAHLFTVDITADEEDISSTSAVAVGEGVETFKLTGNTLWVNQDNKAVEWEISSGARKRELSGACMDAAATGEVVIQTPSGFSFYVEGKDPVQSQCQQCSVTFLMNMAERRFLDSVKVVTTGKGLDVVFPSGIVSVPAEASATAPDALLSFVSDKEAYAVIKGGNQHLYLVGSKTGLIWDRMEGLAAAAATVIANPVTRLDHFSFNKDVLLASTAGVLYSIPLAAMGTRVDVVIDFSISLINTLGLTSMQDVSVQALTMLDATLISIKAQSDRKTVVLTVCLRTKTVTQVSVTEDALLVTPSFRITKGLQLEGQTELETLDAFTVHTTTGLLEGYSVSNANQRAVKTWSLRMPYPIVAHASAHDDPGRVEVVSSLLVYSNRSGKEPVDEVRHRYPTRNVVAVAYYEPVEEELPSLVIVAVDAVTGSVLATTRHNNVEGTVKMVIVEHNLIYYYMDALKMRYCFGVWEMFEEESGPVIQKSAVATLPHIIASSLVKEHRVFSSRAARSPVVVASSLGVYGGPIADMSVTTSRSAIARKNIVMAFETGRVAVVEVRRLLEGGQLPLSTDRQISHVIIPSTALVSHNYRLALPKRIITSPTGIESSCHVFVSGLDLFYVRSSSGKPFDFLNSDFNKPLLIALVCTFVGLSVIVRYLVQRKSLNALWR